MRQHIQNPRQRHWNALWVRVSDVQACLDDLQCALDTAAQQQPRMKLYAWLLRRSLEQIHHHAEPS